MAKRVDRPQKTMVCPTKRDKELGARALRVAQTHIEIAAALLPRLAEALGKIAGWLEEAVNGAA